MIFVVVVMLYVLYGLRKYVLPKYVLCKYVLRKYVCTHLDEIGHLRPLFVERETPANLSFYGTFQQEEIEAFQLINWADLDAAYP